MTTNTPKSTSAPSPKEVKELASLKARFSTLMLSIMEDNGKHNGHFDLIRVWPETSGLAELYEQLSELKTCLDSFRPIAPDTLTNFRETRDIQYTYESNRIEGNSLTLDETQQVIEKGLTIGGKPINDHLEAINHQEAIHFVRELAESSRPYNESTLLTIHQMILKGIRDRDAGAYRKQPVYILQGDGTRHEFPDVYLVPKLMEEYFSFFEEHKSTMHPVEMAAHLHQKLVNVHPFIDGNGRASRLVMNLYLLQNGYPITIIDSEMSKRQEYYRILAEYRQAEKNASVPFERFIAQKVKQSLFEQLDFLSKDQTPEAKDKGYYYFKKIGPYLNK